MTKYGNNLHHFVSVTSVNVSDGPLSPVKVGAELGDGVMNEGVPGLRYVAVSVASIQEPMEAIHVMYNDVAVATSKDVPVFDRVGSGSEDIDVAVATAPSEVAEDAGAALVVVGSILDAAVNGA